VIFSLIFSAFLSFNVNLTDYNCSIYDSKNLIRNEVMLQIVLKNYGYYDSKIDGLFGSASKSALKNFQTQNGLISDGLIGKNTCNSLLDKKNVVTKKTNNLEIENKVIQKSSEALKTSQQKLKELNLYSGPIDGISGTKTKNAIKEFQKKAGLSVDGVLGPNTLAALAKGIDSYISLDASDSSSIKADSSSNTVSTLSALDLRNYDPSKTCIEGYVDQSGIWVTDPCFYPVFVYRFGNIAQVNSQKELDAYLGDRWSLEKEKTYNTIGPVSTINYVDGVHSPVNGLRMPSDANNLIVIGIKNDNNVNARPQSGPQDADAVFEVLVEGGMTRFINLFYESDTSYHGPIRSARPTDPTVLRPLGGVLVASGATGGLIPEIIDIGVPVITDRRPEFFRISSRKAPHNLYADTYKLKNLAISNGFKKFDNPPALFPWGIPNYSKWTSNSYIKLKFSSQTTTMWTWTGNTYLRTYYDAYRGSSSDVPHNWINSSGNSSQINADTIISLFCEPYMHPLQLPSVKTVGQGRAIIMHNGKMLDAFWKRGSNLDPFHIVDQNGNTMYIPPGKPWISLVPNNFSPTFDN
jgi:peptidoglycan hydrolase-like protein with peptidoglycan-binding domain